MQEEITALQKFIDTADEVAKTPPTQVGIQEFADSPVNISFRYWVPTVKFFKTSYAINLAVYKVLQSAGITIPFPQRDVHIISQPFGAGSQAVGQSQER